MGWIDIIKPLSTLLSRAIKESLQHRIIIENVENRIRSRWVRSENSIHCAMWPLPDLNVSAINDAAFLIILQASYTKYCCTFRSIYLIREIPLWCFVSNCSCHLVETIRKSFWNDERYSKLACTKRHSAWLKSTYYRIIFVPLIG